MRVLPSGTAALLLELDDIDSVLAMYTALTDNRPDGVVDIVPAARTVLLVLDPTVTSPAALETSVRRMSARPGERRKGELVEVPVTYDGPDLTAVAELLGCPGEELVRRHTTNEWTVAFCGFAPGFGYLTSPGWPSDIPRRSTPRRSVPPGSVALAGEFSGVYPRESPGGWQLLGRTSLPVFDLSREPAALLRPGTRVRFVNLAAQR